MMAMEFVLSILATTLVILVVFQMNSKELKLVNLVLKSMVIVLNVQVVLCVMLVVMVYL